MSKPFEPMKAEAADLSIVDYVNSWASPKLDGIRAVIRDGRVLSKSMKLLPNPFIQERFGNRPELEGYDGELIVGPPHSPTVYLDTFSGVMTKKRVESDLNFYAFDNFTDPMEEFFRRYDRINPNQQHIVKVQQIPILDEQHVHGLMDLFLSKGFEGMMIRLFQGPRSIYKFGRSTAKEGTLLKRKPIEDFEAQVIGYGEEMQNNNEATTDETGRTKRSSHAENKAGKDTLGFIKCQYHNGLSFDVGIFKGLKDHDLQKLWDERETVPLVGRWAKLQKLAIGEKDRPRHPRWIGWRDPMDM